MATVKIPEQKVILCGEWGVGKSSLFRRFAFDSFISSTDRKSTLGLDFYSKVYSFDSCKDIKLQLFDTGGLERVASVTSSYYKFAEAAILVFSLDDTDSFHALAQHLLEVVSYAENSKLFICGNKSDLRQEVTDEDMESFCEQCHTLISGVFKTCCKTGEGVNEMFQEIAKKIVESNRSRMELQTMESSNSSFKLNYYDNIEGEGNNNGQNDENCLC